ncbi:hypothetical protein LB507_007625 [Fusarium sp. FIESC RH6]|nr:hypothetical protein LB507_007625 [Fusarium sp. FIESC RH6]
MLPLPNMESTTNSISADLANTILTDTDSTDTDPTDNNLIENDLTDTEPSNTDPITNTNWPTLLREVQDDPDNKRVLRLTCDICFELMATSPGQDPGNLCHEAIILPCGHMFGQSCIEEWIQSKERRHYKYSCPKCRAVMKPFVKCHHPIRGRCIPPSRDEYPTVSPMITPGARQFAKCTRCVATGGLELLRKLTGKPRVELEPGQAFVFRLVSPDASQQFIYPYIKGKEYRVDRNFRVPPNVRRVWDRIQNRLNTEAETYWFEMDIGRWELVLSVMDVRDGGQENETVVEAGAAPGEKLFNIYGRE